MKTAKFATSVQYFFITLFFPIISMAQTLELNKLAQYDFLGEDSLHNKAPCHLEVEPIDYDFLHRSYQDYKAYTENVPTAMFALTLRGGSPIRTPDYEDSSGLNFSIAFDRQTITLTTSTADPLNLLSFLLVERGSGTGTLIKIIHCEKIQRKPRT